MTVKLAVPTPQQVEWHDTEIGMFIHWAPNVYQDQEYDDLSTPLDRINPSELDTEQWASVAESLGAKYIVMVAKHVGGFCMWQTDTCDYGVKDTPWRDGKGDVLRDLSESCRKRGLKLGIYLSPQDIYNGAQLAGRCETPEAQEKYNKIYRTQLEEVLSRYGEIFEVWFDGGQEIEVGDILERYVPNAVYFQSKHASIRWIGNEEGIATYPAWNAVRADSEAARGLGTIQHSDPNGEIWMPMECDARIRNTWFWNTQNEGTVKSLDHLMELYYRSVGNGAVLLLNANPDPTGQIPEPDARRAKEFGDEIRKRFANALCEAGGSGDTLEIELMEPTAIDHIVICEDIRYGERIRSYEVLGFDGEQWLKLCSGTAIGHKRIERIAEATLHKLRLNVLKAVDEPRIASLTAYYTGAATVFSPNNIRSERQKVGEWGPELFIYKVDRKSTETYDIGDLIDDAGQYALYFDNADGGASSVRAEGVRLLLNGASYPQFVSQTEDRYRINITGLGQRIQLELELYCELGNNGFGNIWLEKL